MVFRGELQASQVSKTDALGPGQHGAATAATQCLLASPQRLFGAARPYQQQAFEPQAMRLQGSGVGYPGRIHQDGPQALFAEFRQRREQQAEFAQPRVSAHQLGYRTQRPTLAGQARIQPRMPGGQGRLPATALAPLPQPRRGVQQFINGRFTRHARKNNMRRKQHRRRGGAGYPFAGHARAIPGRSIICSRQITVLQRDTRHLLSRFGCGHRVAFTSRSVLGDAFRDLRAVRNSRRAHRDVLSAGDGARAVSPQAKKRSWNAVARVSWKASPDTGRVRSCKSSCGEMFRVVTAVGGSRRRRGLR